MARGVEHDDTLTAFVLPRGGTFVLSDGTQTLATPGGNPIRSISRELLEEVASDLSTYGPNPAVYPSAYCLQLSYIDFVGREGHDRLLISLEDAFDAYLSCISADRRLVLGERHLLTQAVRSLSSRQLMTVIVAGAHLGSYTTGLRLATEELTLPPLCRGMCARYYAAFLTTTYDSLAESCAHPLPGAWTLSEFMPYVAAAGACPVTLADDMPWHRADLRFTPWTYDDDYCESCLASGALNEAQFAGHCAVFEALDKLRRFSQYPEEPSVGRAREGQR